MARQHSDGDFVHGAEFNAAIAAVEHQGVRSGCKVTADPDTGVEWRIKVAAGTITPDASGETSVTEQTLTLSDPDATHRRYDLVVIGAASGTASIVEGTPTTDPVAAPSLATDVVLLGVAEVDPAESQIADADIKDARVFVPNVPYAVGFGGTGSATEATEGAVFYAGASGEHKGDSDELHYDETKKGFGVGTNDVHQDASLHLGATNKAFLLNKLTTAQKGALTSPTEGMLLYDVEVEAAELYRGGDFRSIAVQAAGATSEQIVFIEDDDGTPVLADSPGLTYDGSMLKTSRTDPGPSAMVENTGADGRATSVLKNDARDWRTIVDGADGDKWKLRDETNGVDMLEVAELSDGNALTQALRSRKGLALEAYSEWVFDSDNAGDFTALDSGQQLRIRVGSTLTTMVEVIVLARDATQQTNISVAHKRFYLDIDTTSFGLEQSDDVHFQEFVSGEITAEHTGDNSAWDLVIAHPAAHTNDFRFMSVYLKIFKTGQSGSPPPRVTNLTVEAI